ncbi:uncharacterized protein FA14DRAFT_184211 [Meira miltonrushii]|uniref:Uncharacterized protein n=1 Tax=Meira miltonrushii TaxID=1280837 RepID=A0A316VB66_9BASI|nr:uncharacterized protein FA14DRAFT_184211 [Meira miltonrushii]PWN34746.1 hypothetical protein FA14DRAFT_184211 [Meira miltonrushii]
MFTKIPLLLALSCVCAISLLQCSSAFVLGDLTVRDFQASVQHVDPFLSHLDVNSIKAFETATFGDESVQRPSDSKQKRSDLALTSGNDGVAVQVEKRVAGLFTLAYEFARIAVSPNIYAGAVNGLSFACTIASLTVPKIPTAVKFPCAVIAFFGPVISVLTGQSDVKKAWKAFKDTNSPRQKTFYQMSTMALNLHPPPRGRRSIGNSDLYNQTLMYVSSLHADVSHNNFIAKRNHFVDPTTKQLVSINHFRGTNQTHPKRVGAYNSWLHHYHVVDMYWHTHMGKQYLAASSVPKQEHAKRNCHIDSPVGDNEVDQIGSANDDYIAGCDNPSPVTWSYAQDTVGSLGDFQDVDSNIGNYDENLRLNSGWDFGNRLVNNMADQKWSKGCICIADVKDNKMVSTGLVRADNKADQWDGLEQCNESNPACESATKSS